MTPGNPISRRRLLNLASVAAVAGLPLPVMARVLEGRAAGAAREGIDLGVVPAVGMIEIHDGRLGAPWAAGRKSLETPDPVTTTGRWHIGSNAKSMTATLIARLVEQGRLDWSTPLVRLLPDTPMRDEYRTVTLPDLLSHRAGFARNSAAGIERVDASGETAERYRRRLYIEGALEEAPEGPVSSGPGSYSNTGFVIAGAVAERVAGKPFEQLMQDEVFTPLGIGSVGFGGTPEGEIAGHRAGVPLYGEDADNPDFLRPAGGLHLTLTDWGTFVLDQMQGQAGRGRLLSRESYTLLHRPQGDSQNGLGWGLEPAPNGEPMWSHNGSNGRWFGMVVVLPRSSRAAMVVANAAGDDVERLINGVIVRALDLA